MYKYIISLIILVLIFNVSCGKEEPQNIEDLQKQVQELEKELEKIKTENNDLKKQKDELQNQITSLKQSNLDLTEQLKEVGIIEIGGKVNLTSWTQNEILNGLRKVNSKYNDAGWFTYIYRDDKHYYDQVGPIFNEDLFYDLRYSNRDRELNISGLRIFEINDDKYISYVDTITKATQSDTLLKCEQKVICGGIKTTTCNKSEQTLYIWYIENHLFLARNDNGEALNTFEQFYCQ